MIPVTSKITINPIPFVAETEIPPILKINIAAEELPKLSAPKGDWINPPSRKDLLARTRALKQESEFEAITAKEKVSGIAKYVKTSTSPKVDMNHLAGSRFEHVPKNVTSIMLNFIEPKKIATNVKTVNSEWQHLWGNNGQLDLSNSNITDNDLARIILEYRKCGKLASLNLSNCKNITDAGLGSLANIPLTKLNLSGCSDITDAGLAHFTNAPLTDLNLSDCTAITDAGLAHFANAPLTDLDLRFCSDITDAGLGSFANAPLTYLTLNGCSDITDAGLAHFANAPLTYLTLNGCSDITDAGLGFFANAPLERLDLSNCRGITDAGLAHFANAPLEWLGLSNCSGITNAGLGSFANAPLEQLILFGTSIRGCGTPEGTEIISSEYLLFNHLLNQRKSKEYIDGTSHSDYPPPQSLILGYLED
jgi:hypothetical protein